MWESDSVPEKAGAAAEVVQPSLFRRFSPIEVRKICDVSYRELQYWDMKKLVQPSYRSGLLLQFRSYSYTDVIILWAISTLRTRGITVQRMRKERLGVRMAELLRKLAWPSTESYVICHLAGGDLVVGRPALGDGTPGEVPEGAHILYTKEIRAKALEFLIAQREKDACLMGSLVSTTGSRRLPAGGSGSQ